jgi:Ser/Thr protein kinase RdoA (MazF antagonist)
VSTDRGIKVVKLYRPQWSGDAVRYGHSILLRLEEVGFPAARLVRTPTDDTWTEHGGGLFALFDFVRGANYSLNYLRRADRLRLTTQAAHTLADLHQRLQGFLPEGEHHLGLRADGTRVRDMAWHAAMIDELRERSRELESADAIVPTRHLLDRADDMLGTIAELEERIGAALLPHLVIHGDYGLHNLIFVAAGTAVPVDFEVARFDRRMNDLISAAGKYRFDDGSYDIASIETFFRAYANQFPFTEGELDHLADAWRLYRLRAATQYWNSYFETNGPTRKLESALQAIEQARWVAEHPDEMGRLRLAAAGVAR